MILLRLEIRLIKALLASIRCSAFYAVLCHIYTTTYGCKFAFVDDTPSVLTEVDVDVDVLTEIPVAALPVAVDALVTRHSPPFSIGPGAPKNVDCE